MTEMRSPRGVSDVLGYLMIFGIIVTLTFVATTTGVTEIATQQQVEQVTTVERGFQILDRDFETIQTHKDSRKSTPINIQSGSIGYGETATITVGQWDTSDDEFDANTSVTTHTITYKKDDTDLVYEAGLLFNDKASRDTLSRSETGFVVTDTKAVLPVVTIDPLNPDFGTTPAGKVVIQSIHTGESADIADRTITGDALKIEINSTKPGGWERQLADDGFENIERNGDIVRADIAIEGRSPETAILSETSIRTEIQT